MDERFAAIQHRLNQLSTDELRNILNNLNILCVDTYNYDETNKTYCPLALAMNLHKTIENPTDKLITEAIAERFRPVNVLKGVEGTFYTKNRKHDLFRLVSSIISLRESC